MRVGKTISIETNILAKFLDIVEKKHLDHNAVISKLMALYIKEHDTTTRKLLVCQRCGAKYSDALLDCPNCEVTNIQQRTQEALEKESKERELSAHDQKLIRLQTELESYKNAQKRLNDPAGHNLEPEVLKEQQERIEKEIIRIEAELELAKRGEA